MKYFIGLFRFLVSTAILFIVWQLAVFLFGTPAYMLPSPGAVLSTLFNERMRFLEAAIPTFGNAIVGGCIGVVGGITLGATCAYSKRARWVVEPYLTVFQSFPREAFFPLLIIWLGFGDLPKIVNATLLSIFPMAVVTLDALTDTRRDYLGLFQSWSASKWDVFRYCRVPAAIPAIVGGVRVAAPLALIGSVLGEFLGSSKGLGYIIVSAGSAFRVDRAFAAIVVLAIGGTLIVFAIDALKSSFLKKYFQT